MNIDFSMPANGASARKLLHIADICKINVDPKIEELAKRDLLTIDSSLPAIVRSVVQFIIDCDFRCGLMPIVGIDINTILSLTKENEKVTILSQAQAQGYSEWKLLPNRKNNKNFRIVSMEDAYQLMDGFRDGLLIINWISIDHEILTALATEYRKTIICHFNRDPYVNDASIWSEVASALFPTLNNQINSITQKSIPKLSGVWKTMNPYDFAFFYNVFFPHFAEMSGYKLL